MSKKTDRLFLAEIMNDLHKQGISHQSKAWEMLRDWSRELREETRKTLPPSKLHKIFNEEVGKELWH